MTELLRNEVTTALAKHRGYLVVTSTSPRNSKMMTILRTGVEAQTRLLVKANTATYEGTTNPNRHTSIGVLANRNQASASRALCCIYRDHLLDWFSPRDNIRL